jgi:hypothetical protein
MYVVLTDSNLFLKLKKCIRSNLWCLEPSSTKPFYKTLFPFLATNHRMDGQSIWITNESVKHLILLL